jgi:hypothetical protein
MDAGARNGNIHGARQWRLSVWLALVVLLSMAGNVFAANTASEFPRPLSSYPAMPGASLWQVLVERVHLAPFNLIATVIFVLAVVHTFMAPVFLRLSHRLAGQKSGAGPGTTDAPGQMRFLAEVLHFFGEVEAIFGIWVVPLLAALALRQGWLAAREYLGQGVNFTEPLFVVVIMSIAASRPVLQLSERVMQWAARLGGGSVAAWWFAILTVGPLLGSFITEPAAMTICALLLAERFYRLRPVPALAYGTLGLLFVDVSVGGTLTQFAAPPVLMVAGKWGWGLRHMLSAFGWKAALGIVSANVLYLVYFRREFKTLASADADTLTRAAALHGTAPRARAPIPIWITLVHIGFLAWTVVNNHFPVLFVGGFLFYLAFVQATEPHQDEVALRPALLVGFFLAGLVVHGGLQGWWIAPVLSRLTEVPLFLSATALTAFNDNAAITYLASLVPDFSASLRYAVLAGAVAGGGLTVIANAPNPAGQTILSRFFPDGISALRLFLGALIPTVIVMAVFLIFRLG